MEYLKKKVLKQAQVLKKNTINKNAFRIFSLQPIACNICVKRRYILVRKNFYFFECEKKLESTA